MLICLSLTNFLKHQQLDITFPRKGLVAITGPNASGKSTILMAIRYALFGSAALNGKMEDVKGGSVKLTFELRGRAFSVLRKGSQAHLFDGAGEMLATGAKAVNAKVTELMGFGLDVFDAGVCANQGAIEALSAMRPADRKRLVDDTLGLGALDEIAKWCAEEAAGASREADGVRRTLIQLPEEPVAPSHCKTHFEQEAARLRAAVRQLEDAEAVLRNPGTPPGPEPSTEWRGLNLDEEQRRLARFNDLAGQRIGIENRILEMSVRVGVQADDVRIRKLLEIEAYTHAYETASKFREPELTAEQLEQAEKHHERLKRYAEWKRLHEKGTHTCPACSHSWPVAEHALKALGEDFHEGPPAAPDLSMAQITAGWRDIRRADQERPGFEAAKAMMVRLFLTHEDLRDTFEQIKDQQILLLFGQEALKHKKIKDLQEIKKRLTDQLSYLGNVMHEKDLLRHRVQAAEHAQWVLASERYSVWVKAQLEAQRVVVEHAGAREALEAAQEGVRLWRQYEAAADAYARQKALRTAQDEDLARVEQAAADWRRAREAMAEMRARVKTYLIPSLAAASSLLVSRMTGGRRNVVRITDDFDILLDEQPVETLSGSEKAAANLALRVALGQVLTARTFPVFMADEPDAAMDPNRAELCADALRSLDQNLEQVVLVTHKQIPADLIIELSDN